MMARDQAEIVGKRTVNLQPDLNAGQAAYHPVTEPFPALALSELTFGFVLSGVSGTVTYQPAVRFFNRPDEAPGSWTDLSSPQSPATNERRIFWALGVSPGPNFWAQAGVKVTTAARATMMALVSGKY